MSVETAAGESESVTDLCRSFLGSLPITGASLTVISASGTQLALCSSDYVAARIEELQFELGEGPQVVAARSGELVMIPDVSADLHNDWPVFGAAVRQLDVGALYSVPMRMGAATVGVANLYRNRPGELTDVQAASALAIASAVAATAVQRAMASAAEDGGIESLVVPALRREVHQATGMILVQLNTSATIAYSRLQAYAFANGRTVQEVAHDVVTRKLTFEDTPL